MGGGEKGAVQARLWGCSSLDSEGSLVVLAGEHHAGAAWTSAVRALGSYLRPASTAKLVDGLEHQQHAEHAGVVEGQAAARGVDGEVAIRAGPAARDERAAFARACRSPALPERLDDADGEVVVDLHRVDVVAGQPAM